MEEKKLRQPSKITITIISIISIIIIILTSPLGRIAKGYLFFGTDVCDCKKESSYTSSNMPILTPPSGLAVMTSYRCELCFKKITYGNSNTPVICDTCSTLTNRCNRCGGLK